MSKPVSNVEIEDVLSSIRRLVSNSDRVERVEHKETADVSDKLVLTPSLRVDEASDEVAESIEIVENQDVVDESSGDLKVDEVLSDASQDDDADQSELASDEEFLEFVAKSAEPGDDSVEADEALSDQGDTDDADAEVAIEQLDEILSENAENSIEFVTETDIADTAEEEDGDDTALELRNPADADTEEDEPTGSDAADDLRRRAAEFEAIVAEKDDQWDPDGTTQDENAAVSGGPVPWVDQDEPENADADDDSLPDPLAVFDRATEPTEADEGDNQGETGTDEAVSDDTGDAVSDAAEIADDDAEADLSKLLADVALQGDATESDDADDAKDALQPEEAEAAFTFRAHERVDPPSDEPPAAVEAAPQNADDAPADAPLAIEEALLDEDALRDMVSDIVRQELQGALGERITRNVRKLVRREIHRALASQQLE